MTQSPVHDALSALLITLPERPRCKTLDCPGCELPHLRPKLKVLREEIGAAEFTFTLTDLLQASRDTRHPNAARLRRGLVGLRILTPDLLPRPSLAFLQLNEILVRYRKSRRGSPVPQGRVTQSSVTLLAVRRMGSGQNLEGAESPLVGLRHSQRACHKAPVAVDSSKQMRLRKHSP